jgi:hypothetical protein
MIVGSKNSIVKGWRRGRYYLVPQRTKGFDMFRGGALAQPSARLQARLLRVIAGMNVHSRKGVVKIKSRQSKPGDRKNQRREFKRGVKRSGREQWQQN